MKRGWTLIAVWAAIATSLNLLRYDLDDGFGLLELGRKILLWCGYLAILAYAVAQGIKRKATRPSILLIGGVALTGLIFQLDGRRLSLLVRFHVLKSRYEAVVRDLEAGRVPATGTEYRVDVGPPLRVAFKWGDGLLDNWQAVVYDPTGLVLKARLLKRDLSNLHDPEFREAVQLFGGDLCYCEPLGGDWYFCGFT